MIYNHEALEKLIESFDRINTPDFTYVKSFNGSIDLQTKTYASLKNWMDFSKDEFLYCHSDILSIFCPEYSRIFIPGFIGNIAIFGCENVDTIPDKLFYYLRKVENSEKYISELLYLFEFEEIYCINEILKIFSRIDFFVDYEIEKYIKNFDIYIKNNK